MAAGYQCLHLTTLDAGRYPMTQNPSLGLFSQQWHRWMIIYPEQFITCILVKITKFDDKFCYEINDAVSQILNVDLENL